MADSNGNRKKIGAKVDADVYDEFVEFVQEKRGQKRGVLGGEIENALKEYMTDGLTAESESDGVTNEDLLEEIRGVTPSSLPDETGDTHTHRDDANGDVTGVSDTTDNSSEKTNSKGTEEKPHAKAPRSAKVSWLVSRTDLRGQVPLVAIENHVKEHYPLREDTVKELAWAVAGELSPSESDIPRDVEDAPRTHSYGAWYRINRVGNPGTPDATETTYCYMRDSGLEAWVVDGRDAEDDGSETSDGEPGDEEPTDEESGDDESDELDFDGVDIDGSESSGEGTDGLSVDDVGDEVFNE
jgi:hypothetical protein